VSSGNAEDVKEKRLSSMYAMFLLLD